MAALGSNISLLEIDLESNLIGKSETMKVVRARRPLGLLKIDGMITARLLGFVDYFLVQAYVTIHGKIVFLA